MQKPSKDGSRIYEEIAGITPLMKSQVCPPAINNRQELNYDDFDEKLFESLPDYVKDKIKASKEYHEKFLNEHFGDGKAKDEKADDDDLPF